MLAKITSKNQITIPKKIMAQLPGTHYFDLKLENGMVMLKPVAVDDTHLDVIRQKIRQLGLTPDCVQEAIRWARK